MTVISVLAPLSVDPADLIGAAARRAGRPVDIRYDLSLLPPQRWVADHAGDPAWRRSASQQQRWHDLLRDTNVAFGIPGDSPAGLRDLVTAAPGLTWVQATAAGAGEQLARAGLDADAQARLTVTSAAGIHATPLAEFAVFGLLAFSKDLDRLLAGQRAARWAPRWPMRQLRGAHIVVLGLGGIGREVVRLCAAFGASVTGVRRRVDGAGVPGASRVEPLAKLDAVLPEADAVVVALPGTPESHHLLNADRLALLPAHAIVVNVGRGSVVDGAALLSALERDRLRGAVLDVTDPEPLPATSPLWHRPDVLISPHTAALSADEDLRLAELFADNLQRWLTGRPLRNVVDPDAGY